MIAKTEIARRRGRHAYLQLTYDVIPAVDSCIIMSETTADREFWQTQLDVLEDVKNAINEHIHPKSETNP